MEIPCASSSCYRDSHWSVFMHICLCITDLNCAHLLLILADEDFSDRSTSVGFGPGEESRQCTFVEILDDDTAEHTETFTITLETLYNNVILSTPAQVTLLPDDDSKFCYLLLRILCLFTIWGYLCMHSCGTKISVHIIHCDRR